MGTSCQINHNTHTVVWCDHTVVGFVKVLGFCCGCFVPRCHFFPLRLSWHFSSINFFSLSPCFLWIWLNFPLITYNWIWAIITFVPLVFLMLIATQLFFLPFFLFSSSLFFLFLNLKSFNLPFATLVGSRLWFFSKPMCIHPHTFHTEALKHTNTDRAPRVHLYTHGTWQSHFLLYTRNLLTFYQATLHALFTHFLHLKHSHGNLIKPHFSLDCSAGLFEKKWTRY